MRELTLPMHPLQSLLEMGKYMLGTTSQMSTQMSTPMSTQMSILMSTQMLLSVLYDTCTWYV